MGVLHYELTGEWLDAERSQYKEIRNHFKNNGYPDLSPENVISLRETVSSSFETMTPEQKEICSQCKIEREEIDGHPYGSDNGSLGFYIYKKKENLDTNRKAVIYFRGGGAVLLKAKHHQAQGCEMALKNDVVVFNVDYMNAPEAKAP